MKKAVVLLSGGMDSLVTLAVAMQEYDVLPLHVGYGAKTQNKEKECFDKIISHYSLNSKSLALKIDYFARIKGSSLTDPSLEPEKGAPKSNEIPSSYVPFRNSNLLSIAVSFGEVKGASKVFYGAVESDSSGYPDCTKEYVEAFNALIKTGSKVKDGLQVMAPLIDMAKADIVKKGVQMDVPFEFTWSCYGKEDIACGTCHSCYLRLKAFREAKIKDPLLYEKGTV